jgi:hypothetical protein
VSPRSGERAGRARGYRRASVLAVPAIGLALAAALAVCSGGDGDDRNGGAGDGGTRMTSTTVNTGGLEVAAPDGWLAIPVPDLGFGIAVPPGWEATVLSPEGLATLARSSPRVPGFVDLAHAAAGSGGLVYAAGQDAAGGISDVMVRGAPQAGVADAAGLEAYARDLAARAGRADPEIEVVEGGPYPTVRMGFRVGGGEAGAEQTAEGTESLVAGPGDIVWSVIVTSDDAASHDDLAAQITGTLTLAAG